MCVKPAAAEELRPLQSAARYRQTCPSQLFSASHQHRSVPVPLPTSICSRAAAETMGVIKPTKWLEGSSLWRLKLMWKAALEQRVTAESPKGPDCQSMKMDWMIYVFANFSSESLVATRNNGLTLQTWNCHLEVTFSPFIYATFFCDCVSLISQWDPQIGVRNTGRVWGVPSAKCKLILQPCRKRTSHNRSSQLHHSHVFMLTWKAPAYIDGKTSLTSVRKMPAVAPFVADNLRRRTEAEVSIQLLCSIKQC